LLKHKDKKTVNPLNLNQWSFYVVSTKKINKYHGNKKTISLNSLEKMTKNINYDKIKEMVQNEYLNKEPIEI